MSLLARRHWRCASRGQCVPGPRAHSLGSLSPAAGAPKELGPGQAAGKLCVTAPAGDFTIRALGPGEEEPEAPHPLHHCGDSSGIRFGVLTDF